jgi:hypothetical protein
VVTRQTKPDFAKQRFLDKTETTARQTRRKQIDDGHN